jgi:hypothetical protein
MKRIIVKLMMLVFSISLLFNGCASSKLEVKNHFRFEVIDSVLKKNNGNICFVLSNIDSYSIDKYNVLHCHYCEKENNKIIDSIYFFILSEKEKDSTIDLELYEKLSNSEKYCLNIFTVDTLIKTGAKFRGYNVGFAYDDGSGNTISFWRNERIVAKVYFCNDIKDKYILKKRN